VNELSDQVFLHFFREHRKYLICYDVTNLNKTNDFFRKLDEDEGYRSKFMQFFEFFYIDNEHVLSLMHFFLSYCGRCSAKQVEELRCNFDFIYKYAHNSLGLVRGYNYDISDVFKENVFSASLFFYVASPESQHNATGMLVNSLNTAFGNHSMDFIAALREDCKKSLLLFFHLLAKYGVNVRKLPWLLDVVIDATGLNDSMDLFTILFPKFIENFEQGSMPVECDKGNDKFGNTLLCAIYVLFPDVTAKKPRYKMLLQSIACLQAGDYDHSIDASYRQRWSVIYNQIKAEAIEGLHEGKLNGDIENL